MQKISVETFKNIIINQAGNPEVDFINVCTPTEYAEKRIEGVRNVPLDEITQHLDEFKDKKTIYVHCRSGKRAAKAIEQLRDSGIHAELVNIDGGLLAWDEAGLPTESDTKRLPLMRQVLLSAGTLILIGMALGWFVHPVWYLLTTFIGLGLSFAGLTGWCGMSYFLSKMPWNTP